MKSASNKENGPSIHLHQHTHHHYPVLHEDFKTPPRFSNNGVGVLEPGANVSQQVNINIITIQCTHENNKITGGNNGGPGNYCTQQYNTQTGLNEDNQ
jgi:hypothetical protein